MDLRDLDKVLQEYLKHFGKDEFGKYFKQMINIKGEKKDATSKKETNSSSRSDKRTGS